MKRGKYLINKNNLFVLIALVIILGGIFIVNAYDPTFSYFNEPYANQMGHTSDEIMITPPGGGVSRPLQKAIDDGYISWGGVGGGTADCSSGQVKIGDTCKILTACGVGKALSWDGTSFSCKSITLTETTYSWKKVCNSVGNNGLPADNQYTVNCLSVGGGYGENLHYGILGKAYTGYCLKNSGAYLRSGVITSCTENAECTNEGQYCVKNFNEVEYDLTYVNNIDGGYCQNPIWHDNFPKVYEDYSPSGAIYRCLPD